MNIPELDKLLTKYAKANSGASKSTISNFTSAMRRLPKILNVSEFNKIGVKWLDDPAKFVEMASKDFKDSSIRATVGQILKLIKLQKMPADIYQLWSGAYIELTKGEQVTARDNLKTDRETKQWVEWPDMQEQFYDYIENRDLEKQSHNDFMKLLILALFIDDIPRRLGNYVNMTVVRRKLSPSGIDPKQYMDTENENMIVIYSGKINEYLFVFNKFKTVKELGPTYYNVPKDSVLHSMLDIWFTEHNSDSDVFLKSKFDKPLSRQSIGNILNHATEVIYRKAFSVDIIRHSFLTWFMGKKPQPSVNDKIKIARQMGQIYRPNRMEMYIRL